MNAKRIYQVPQTAMLGMNASQHVLTTSDNGPLPVPDGNVIDIRVDGIEGI